MTREFDFDPEVLADLELRETSQRDPSRTKRADYAWTAPVIVASWPCRVCKRPWDVTQEALDALAAFNAILVRRGEPELDSARLAICEHCRTEAFRMRGDRNRERTTAMADLIRKLKSDPSRDEEAELIRKLRAMNHPDVDALVGAIRDRKAAGKGRRAKEI